MNNNSFGEVSHNIRKNKQTTFKIKIHECTQKNKIKKKSQFLANGIFG